MKTLPTLMINPPSAITSVGAANLNGSEESLVRFPENVYYHWEEQYSVEERSKWFEAMQAIRPVR